MAHSGLQSSGCWRQRTGQPGDQLSPPDNREEIENCGTALQTIRAAGRCVPQWKSSENLAGFLETQARTARAQRFALSITYVDQEIGTYRRVAKELSIHTGIVETGHRTAIQTQRTRRQYQIGTLQAAVPYHGRQQFLGSLLGKPGARIGMRKQLRQLVVELHVHAYDGSCRSGHGLGQIALIKERRQSCFPFRSVDENDA